MDKSEARKILSEGLDRFAERGYEALVRLVESEQVENFEVDGESGARYQVELQCLWDDKRKGRVRIVGSIHDGGIRVIVPLTQALTIPQPDGKCA